MEGSPQGGQQGASGGGGGYRRGHAHQPRGLLGVRPAGRATTVVQLLLGSVREVELVFAPDRGEIVVFPVKTSCCYSDALKGEPA